MRASFAVMGSMLLVMFLPALNAQHLGLNIQDSGLFQITYDSEPWLVGGEVMVAGLSSSTNGIAPSKPFSTTGHDHFGQYSATTFIWSQSNSGKDLMHTTFRTYPKDPSMIVFEQFFPSDITNAPNPLNLSAQTIFPSFDRSGSSNLNCFAYHAVFPTMSSCNLSNYQDTHQGGVPLVLYNSSSPSLSMSVFSSLNSPKAHHMASAAKFVGAGVKATVGVIPAGWSQMFILAAGVGINDGMMTWGDKMLKYSGKARPSLYYDLTHSTIGFWTDNGGYYHYSTGVGNKTYEETLPKVKAYHDSIGVPFRHWQFDSWFYPKDGNVTPSGGGGAVTNWTAMPSVFPSGMAGIQSLLNVPMIMHNRQWSTHSEYMTNDPQFKWYVSALAAVPQDPEAFFRWFFQQQQGWGLAMYEQDWMNVEYDEVAALQTNISMGDLWLKGMAEGAGASGRAVQYCMPYPNDIMSGSAHPAVTNARATGDYFHAKDQWAIGGTALYYWALGVIPFKDGFYSSTNRQIGGQTEGPELNPDREIIMATLSGAMVGPMDGIYLLNVSRTMASCRKDGYILKANRPVTMVDTCFRHGFSANVAECYLFQTYSIINSTRVHYLFSDAVRPISPDMVYMTNDDQAVVYNWYSGELIPLSSSTIAEPGYEGHIYAIISPILSSKWAFIGETNKYVTASNLRFSGLTFDSQALSVLVLGLEDETVTVCAAVNSSNTWLLRCSDTKFDHTESKMVTLSA